MALLSQVVQLQLYVLIYVVLQPHTCRNNYGLGSSPFARHYLGNHYCFLFLRVLRCFSSRVCFPFWMIYVFNIMGFPIRKSPDQILFANPRSLSQLITSFFASESQGIPHTPLITSFNDLSFSKINLDRYSEQIITLLEFFLCARSCCKSVSSAFSSRMSTPHHLHYFLISLSPRFPPRRLLLFTTLSSACQ